MFNSKASTFYPRKISFVENKKLGSHICQINKININPISSLILKKNLQKKFFYHSLLYILQCFRRFLHPWNIRVFLSPMTISELVCGKKQMDTIPWLFWSTFLWPVVNVSILFEISDFLTCWSFNSRFCWLNFIIVSTVLCIEITHWNVIRVYLVSLILRLSVWVECDLVIHVIRSTLWYHRASSVRNILLSLDLYHFSFLF